MGKAAKSKSDALADQPASEHRHDPEWVTVGRCSYVTCRSTVWIRRQIERGRLPAVVDSSGRRLIRKEDLETFLERLNREKAVQQGSR
jgi:hypothetical protein